MNRIARFFAILALWLPVMCFSAQQPPAIVLGVFPYLSPSQMIEQLAPLRKHIEQTLGKQVSMQSAPDFLSFVERTAKGDYDLVITAPHMGRLAQKRDGWQLVAMSGQQTATVILVRKDSGITRLDQLRGKRMATGSLRSVTYLLAEEALQKKGIKPGQNLDVIETATFSNVVQSVFKGEAAAGATPTLLWDKWVHVNAEQHGQLTEIFRAPPPNPNSFLVMCPPGTDQATILRLREGLLSFGNTPAGREFLQKSQFESFLPPDERAMARNDAFVHALLP
ncbi:MAG: phosphate/phosphite/phosphonate ABC transporter substrate-binding protein [Pseudomonadota bacterium]